MELILTFLTLLIEKVKQQKQDINSLYAFYCHITGTEDNS